MPLSHLSKVRRAAELLAIQGQLSASKGDYESAVGDMLAGMRLGDALAQEPIFMSQFCRTGIYDRIRRVVLELRGEDLSDRDMSRLLDHLEGAYRREAFADAFAGERANIEWIFENIRNGDLAWDYSPFEETSTLGQLVRNTPFIEKIYQGPAYEPMRNMDEATALDIMDRVREAAELPYFEARPYFDQIYRERENAPRTHVVTQRYLPSFGFCYAQARHEARVDLMRMGLVIERYHGDHGTYPERLEEIAPRLGGTLPIDPFSGKQYRYRTVNLGSEPRFYLYSIGRDGVDSFGTTARDRDDITWRDKAARP